MKYLPILLSLVVLLAVFTVGCTEPPDETEQDKTEDETNYTNFTNGEFYVEYPTGWTVYTEDSSAAGLSTKSFFVAEDDMGAGIIVRGHKASSSSLMDYDEWYESALGNLQSSEDANVLSNGLSTNEAQIEFTELKSGSVTVYSKYKFLGCTETVYQCTASVENLLRGQYQDKIDHIISSFSCVN